MTIHISFICVEGGDGSKQVGSTFKGECLPSFRYKKENFKKTIKRNNDFLQSTRFEVKILPAFPYIQIQINKKPIVQPNASYLIFKTDY